TTMNLFSGPLYNDQPLQFSRQGSALATPEQYEETRRMLAVAAGAAQERGITLCLEIHNGYIHDLARTTVELLDRVGAPNLMANFDYGNVALNRNGESLDDALAILRGRIGYVHLKNVKLVPRGDEGAFFVTELRAGDINHHLLLRGLLDGGYAGLICLENTMKGDRY